MRSHSVTSDFSMRLRQPKPTSRTTLEVSSLMVLFRPPYVTFPLAERNALGKYHYLRRKNYLASKEVAEFLESDRKRQAAEERSDRRHTSKSESEPVPATAQGVAFSDPTWTSALRNLTLENCIK